MMARQALHKSGRDIPLEVVAVSTVKGRIDMKEQCGLGDSRRAPFDPAHGDRIQEPCSAPTGDRMTSHVLFIVMHDAQQTQETKGLYSAGEDFMILALFAFCKHSPGNHAGTIFETF
jgi:hypothetical protein